MFRYCIASGQHTQEILLADREALGIGEVVVELLDVRVEVVDRVGGDEAEDLHAAVHANPEFPSLAFDVDIALARTNGLNSAVSSEPR